MIGQDGNDLYGIACNDRAYMRKQSTQGAWYGIEKKVWQDAKAKNSNIQDNLVKIEEDYSHTGDPEDIKTKGNVTVWGGNCLISCCHVVVIIIFIFSFYPFFILFNTPPTTQQNKGEEKTLSRLNEQD